MKDAAQSSGLQTGSSIARANAAVKWGLRRSRKPVGGSAANPPVRKATKAASAAV